MFFTDLDRSKNYWSRHTPLWSKGFSCIGFCRHCKILFLKFQLNCLLCDCFLFLEIFKPGFPSEKMWCLLFQQLYIGQTSWGLFFVFRHRILLPIYVMLSIKFTVYAMLWFSQKLSFDFTNRQRRFLRICLIKHCINFNSWSVIIYNKMDSFLLVSFVILYC